MTLETLLIVGLVLNGTILIIVSIWSSVMISILRHENAKLRGWTSEEIDREFAKPWGYTWND